MKSVLRLALICLLVLGTTACGVRLAYNNLDWLIMRWVNKQVTLSSEQELRVRDALIDKLNWHCASELPDYIALIERLDADLAGSRLDATRLAAHSEQLSLFAERLLERTLPTLNELFSSLDDDQVVELLAGVDQRNRDLIRDSYPGEPARRREESIERFERGLKRFIGNPNPAQRTRLESWADSLKPSSTLTVAQGLRWRGRLADTLAVRQDRERFDRRMSSLFRPESEWTAAYRSAMASNRERTLEALVDIHALSTPAQQRRLRSRLEKLAKDFTRLSCAA